MTTNDSQTTSITIDRETASRILRARGRMPYGGMVHTPAFVDAGYSTREGTGTINLSGLARYLEDLADVLERVVETANKRDDRLTRLEHILQAGRLLMQELTTDS